MEFRPIEVKLICAKDLKNVNIFSKMDVYVMGSVSGDPNSIQKTHVHKRAGRDPVWNYRFKFVVDESAVKLNRLGLVFKIVSNRFLGDREIGRVYVPLKEFAGKENSSEISVEERYMVYRVQTPSGKFKGSLEFSYKVGEKFIKNVDRKPDEPVPAYPAWPGPSSNSGPGASALPYPVQSNGYGYGYGYSTQQPVPPPNPQVGYGYGYSGQVQQKNSNGLGMGIGAGLLGGFLLGEMMEDIVDDGF